MRDPDELALVVKAIKSGLGGCVEWDHTVVERIRDELLPFRLGPKEVQEALIAYVRGGGKVGQVVEKRHGWKDCREFYYKVILPMSAQFKKGLFVELILFDADEDYPEVRLVNAHEQD